MMRKLFSRSVIGVGAVAAALMVPLAAPASAEDEYVACSWAHDRGQGTRVCGSSTFTYLGQAVSKTCWKLRPSSKTYIQRRFDGSWYRQTENAMVRITRSGCTSAFPWQVRATVAVGADEAGQTAYFRIVMPKTSQYNTTYYRFDACALPAYSEGVCR